MCNTQVFFFLVSLLARKRDTVVFFIAFRCTEIFTIHWKTVSEDIRPPSTTLAYIYTQCCIVAIWTLLLLKHNLTLCSHMPTVLSLTIPDLSKRKIIKPQIILDTQVYPCIKSIVKQGQQLSCQVYVYLTGVKIVTIYPHFCYVVGYRAIFWLSRN